MYSIYVITNKINGKIYVGFTSKTIEARFANHVKEAFEGSTRILCRAIRKYGADAFSVELLATARTIEEARESEIRYIKKLNSFCYLPGSNGYNQTLGGDGANGLRISKKTRDKLREIHRIKWTGEGNPKFKKGHLYSGVNHPMFGRKHRKDSLLKMSESLKGKYIGENNPSAVNEVTFSLEASTGEIKKFDSFYQMRNYFSQNGIKLNRSNVLKTIRGDSPFHHGFRFFRKDITPIELFEEIEHKYETKEFIPIQIEDHRVGKRHPNAKNKLSFAVDSDGKIHKFDSWFDLKQYLDSKFDGITYSNMAKTLNGKYKTLKGHCLYREGVTDEETMNRIQEDYLKQTFND